MAQRVRIALALGVLLTLQGPNLPPVAAGTPSSSGRAFHELNVKGLPNAAGFSIVGARRAENAYSLDIVGFALVARPRAPRAPALTGSELVGLELELRDAAGRRSAVQIAGIDETTYWAGPADTLPTYRLTFTSTTHAVPQPLCTAGENEAFLFGGDRYDADRKTVTATGPATADWFNIACAGTALAKLHLTRHTEASQVVKTTAVERQAMLKMFTADICGDGTAFTVHGEPLLWADANQLTSFATRPASLEAVWTDRGAVCLDAPRRPELGAAIAARCGPLPRCTTQRGYVISANPD
jgi:hypothetical protein